MIQTEAAEEIKKHFM